MTVRTPARRPAFTMVELLVVIAIMAVLIGLLTAAVQKARGTMKRATTTTEMSELTTVLATFKKDHGFYPPSHVTINDQTTGLPLLVRFQVPIVVVDPGVNPGATNAQRQQHASYLVLKQMFPRWNPVLPDGVTITPALPRAGEVLSPNAAMVYFLAGPAGQGWDPAQPTVPSGATKKGPYYDFKTDRVNAANEYVDVWKTPYAYFSADNKRDTYDARAQFPWPTDPAPDFGPGAGNTAHPYHDGSKWLNPGLCQIISAGPDRTFGPGSYKTAAAGPLNSWTPGVGGYIANSPGADDLANFNDGTQLGG